MRRVLSLAAVAVLAALALLWWTGGFDQLAAWAALRQREFQNEIATGLRAARAGQVGAVIALLSACFAYGVVHAAGPGHGKVLIGGYGMARAVPVLRLAVIGLAASLGQAVTAVALAWGGILLFDLGRTALIGWTERVMAPASYAAIALIGGWLVWRGLRRSRRTPQEDHVCASCGHAHGPSPEQVAKADNPRAALALIAGIALRPCTGALFVLIITWQMGIGMLGIAGTFAMALGTAVITVAVGMGAGALRGGVLAGFAGSERAARIGAAVEVAAGIAVVMLAGGLLLRSLPSL